MGETAMQDSGAENSIDAAAPGTIPPKKGVARVFTVEMLLAIIAILSGVTLLWTALAPSHSIPIMITAGAMFTLSIVLVIRLSMDPDSVRARQSDAMLRLASKTLESMQDGLNRESAQVSGADSRFRPSCKLWRVLLARRNMAAD